MTFEQAKDQVAKEIEILRTLQLLSDRYFSQEEFDRLKYLVNNSDIEAAELYARSMAAQAWEEGLSTGLKAFQNDSIPHNPYKP